MSSRRRVLVLGGTRYFGKRLITKLIAARDDVTIVTRGETKDPFGSAIKRRIADRRDAAAMKRALSGSDWDVIYDQICYSPDEAAIACELFDGRVGRYVHTSTQSIYPNSGRLVESDVDPYTYPIKMGSREDFPYGEAKRLAETVFFQRARFNIAAMRICIVLGADDYTRRLEFHIDRVKSGRPLVIENLDAENCFISSQEAADFLFWLGQQSCKGPVNACSDGTIAMRHLVELIEKAAGKKANVQAQGDPKDLTPVSEAVSNYLDNTRAKELGFRFRRLDEWLPDLIQEKLTET